MKLFKPPYLLKDLRITRFVNRDGGVDLVDELEKKEDEKIYEEWLDNQRKERELEAQKKQLTEQDTLVTLDQKEALFFEIKKILTQQALGQGRGGSAQGISSLYERMQISKQDILDTHKQIGKTYF